MNDNKPIQKVETDLRMLGLNFMAQQYNQLANKATLDATNHVDY